MSLPDGWIQQYDPNYNHPFWVDTRASPPRAIWVHPYEDEQFLNEHPELRPKRDTGLDAPPSYDVATSGDTRDSQEGSSSAKRAGSSSHTVHKRGVIGRLRDKAIGTKEEREEHKRVRAEQAAQAEERARQARMREREEREAYMRAHGGYAPYHASYVGYPSYYNNPPGPRRGLGMDDTAALLLGGLAGGLLLGDIFSGGF